jgi:predicted metal-binding membrane protein
MSSTSEPIGYLRRITSRPAMLLWVVTSAAFLALVLSLHSQLAGHSEQGWIDVLARLCGPGKGGSGFREWVVVAMLWHSMTLAMMLPVATPMISAYLDIAEAARSKGLNVVAAAYLAAGYCAVWLAFSSAATALQLWIGQSPRLILADNAVGAAVLLVAGAYQFAPLKHACLRKCRAPIPYFLARWSERRGDVFRMGLDQGLLCLGCCFALMLLMTVAGVTNVIWMAGLTALVLLEKTLPQPQSVVYGSGAGLIAAGLLLLTGG